MIKLIMRSWPLSISVITIITTIAGLFAYGVPWWIPVLPIIIILSTCFCVVLLSNIRFLKSVQTGYAAYVTESIILKRSVEIEVSLVYEATINIERDIVFLGNPKPDDLIDLIDTKPGFEFSTQQYVSSDSYISSVKTVKPHLMTIQWTPYYSIRPYIPYRHLTRNTSPSKYGPDGFYYSTYFDRATGIAKYCVKVANPLGEVVAFIMPRFAQETSDWIIQQCGLDARERRCTQPILSEDGKTVLWELVNPIIGRTYILAAIYVGQHKIVEQGALESAPNWLRRTLIKMFP